jgi:hypothetical protein
MPVCTGFRHPVEQPEKPGPLQLAIREWQRQLNAMAEASRRQAVSGRGRGFRM